MFCSRNRIKVAVLAVTGGCLMSGCAGDAQEAASAEVLQPRTLEEMAVSLEPVSGSSEQTGSGGQEGSVTESSVPVDVIPENSASEEEVPETVTITVSVAGDATLGVHKEQEYWYSFRQAYDEAESDSYFFANVYDIFSADDLTLVNLEGPLTLAEEAREGQVYSIKGDPEYVDILTAGSVEAVSMGNNHMMDYLQQGKDDTIHAVEEAGVVYACEETVGIYETKGICIGMISVNEVSQGYLVEKTIQTGIAELQEQGADLILVSCHWGVEREYTPEDYQKILGEKCIDWGADLVIGHHPHVLQGVDEYKGKYIIYSLGNFCFGANRNPPDKDTMIFQQTFTFTDGVKQEDQEIRIIPCSVSSVPERNNFQPTPAEGEEKIRIINRMNEFSQEFGVQFDEDGYLRP